MTMTDTLVYMALCFVTIGFMFIMILMLRKDVKEYREALKAHLEESVDDGYNAARTKDARSLQSYRSRELSSKESVAPKK